MNDKKWLWIIGIGEDGLSELSAIARSLIDSAEILVGGDRHLAKRSAIALNFGLTD